MKDEKVRSKRKCWYLADAGGVQVEGSSTPSHDLPLAEYFNILGEIFNRVANPSTPRPVKTIQERSPVLQVPL